MRSDREESEEERIGRKYKISIGKSESGMPEKRCGRLGTGGQAETSECRVEEAKGEAVKKAGASDDTQYATAEVRRHVSPPPASTIQPPTPTDRGQPEKGVMDDVRGDSGMLDERERKKILSEALSTTAGRESIGAEPYGPGTVDAEKLPTKRGATYRIAYAGEEGTEEEKRETPDRPESKEE